MENVVTPTWLFCEIVLHLSSHLEMFMIDELDQKLILELQKDGRQAFVDLANKLGVSEGTVRKRLKQLIDKDTIEIVGLPNLRQLGYGFVAIMAFQVRMEDLKRAADMLSQDDRVCYLSLVTGRYDLMAIVICRSQEDLSKFIENKVSTLVGIVRSETFVSLNVFKGNIPEIDSNKLIEKLLLPSPQ